MENGSGRGRMDEMQRLSALIGDIYDAALDPMLWQGVLASTTTFVGGSGAGLWTRDWSRQWRAQSRTYIKGAKR